MSADYDHDDADDRANDDDDDDDADDRANDDDDDDDADDRANDDDDDDDADDRANDDDDDDDDDYGDDDDEHDLYFPRCGLKLKHLWCKSSGPPNRNFFPFRAMEWPLPCGRGASPLKGCPAPSAI